MAPKKVRLPQYSHKGPIPGPEMVRRAGLKDALAQHEGQSAGGRVASRFFHNIGADAMSDIHSLDPRTKSGAINLMAMFAGGKSDGMSEGAMAEAALHQHLGHAEFRPYNTSNVSELGGLTSPDHRLYGGMTQRDLGYQNPLAAKPEVVNMINQIIAGKKPDIRGFLTPPYRTMRGLRG